MTELDVLERQAKELRDEAMEKIAQAEAIEKKIAEAKKAIEEAQSKAKYS